MVARPAEPVEVVGVIPRGQAPSLVDRSSAGVVAERMLLREDYLSFAEPQPAACGPSRLTGTVAESNSPDAMRDLDVPFSTLPNWLTVPSLASLGVRPGAGYKRAGE